jgi:hypothetical protein
MWICGGFSLLGWRRVVVEGGYGGFVVVGGGYGERLKMEVVRRERKWKKVS